jgi:hypothetical protein
MTAPVINISTLANISGIGKGEFKHKVTKGNLPESSQIWFSKEMENPQTAYLEVLAQEFFRLIIPGQPETRIARNEALNTYYILSAEVPGFKNLPKYKQTMFSRGPYKGLGRIMMVCVFVHEIDLKNGNIGLNFQNEVIKIDGDWCFVSIRDPKKCSLEQSKISENLIKNLPYIPDFYAFNWLDIKEEGVSQASSNFVNHSLSYSPIFRGEINQAMLRILLLPDSYIKKFVDAYIPVGSNADRFINFLINRRSELQIAALQNESFVNYIASGEAAEEAVKHLAHMKAFTANGSHTVISEAEFQTIEKDFSARQQQLLASRELELTKEETSFGATDETSSEAKEDLILRSETISPPQEKKEALKSIQTVNRLQWVSFVAGLLVSSAVMLLLMALRIIDLTTLGLSLPVTILASIAMVAMASIVSGILTSFLSELVSNRQSSTPVISTKNKDKTVSASIHLVDDQLVTEFSRQSEIVNSITNPTSSKNTETNVEREERSNNDFKPTFGVPR